MVFTRREVADVLARLSGQHRLQAELMYGAGLRVHEAMSLRVKDLDFESAEITVRDGKGGKDRRVMCAPCGTQYLKLATEPTR